MPVSSFGRDRLGSNWALAHRDLGIWPPPSKTRVHSGVQATLDNFRTLAFVHKRRAVPVAARLVFRMIHARWFEPVTHRVAIRVLDDLLLDEGRTLIIVSRDQWVGIIDMIRQGDVTERDFVRWVARRAPRRT